MICSSVISRIAREKVTTSDSRIVVLYLRHDKEEIINSKFDRKTTYMYLLLIEGVFANEVPILAYRVESQYAK